MRVAAQLVSYLFHPMLLFFYLVCLGYWFNPYSFATSNPKQLGLYFIMSFMLLVIFPTIAALLMKRLKLTSSLEMYERQERIGPLIGALIFYIWYFINIKNDGVFPSHIVFLSLGGVIALSIGFFINNFTKISLHTIGAGAFVAAIVLLTFGYGFDYISLNGDGQMYRIYGQLLIAIALLIAGLIGTARLLLGAHSYSDLYGGYAAGVFAMIVAYRISTVFSL